MSRGSFSQWLWSQLIDRAVASDTKGVQFESLHRHSIFLYRKDKYRKDAGH